MKIQLSRKFEACILKHDAATPLTISNFSRAWQAYFWSYTLQILCENTTFIDVQMMCSDDFDISSGFRFGKISVKCSVHFYSLYFSCSSVPPSGLIVLINSCKGQIIILLHFRDEKKIQPWHGQITKLLWRN